MTTRPRAGAGSTPRDRHGAVCRRLAAAFRVLAGGPHAVRAGMADTPAQLRCDARSCLDRERDLLPWPDQVSDQVCDAILPAIADPDRWRSWRLDYRPDPTRRRPSGADDAGAALLAWFAALGDTASATDAERLAYAAACRRLNQALATLPVHRSRVCRYLRLKAAQDPLAMEWNALPHAQRGSDANRARFKPLFDLCQEILAMDDAAARLTSVSTPKNALAYASVFGLTNHYDSLRTALEDAWAVHHGHVRPDYLDRRPEMFDADFDDFRAYLATLGAER